MWVDYYVDAVGGKGGITKLKFRWHFDEMFTSMVQSDFNIKKMTPSDVVMLRDHAFANLKNYHYYTNIKVDGTAFEPTTISDFDAKLAGKYLEYFFTITLPHPAKDIEIAMFDPEFYVDIGPPMTNPTANQPGIMAGATSDPKPFVSASAEAGAKVPACAWHSGESRVSPTWGKFPVYVVTCHAEN